jgi:hypothetical protein
MFGAWPESSYLPCEECGASLASPAVGEHVCDAERRVDFRLFQLRGEIASFDEQLSAWLASARGRFAAWLAERDRLQTSEA